MKNTRLENRVYIYTRHIHALFISPRDAMRATKPSSHLTSTSVPKTLKAETRVDVVVLDSVGQRKTHISDCSVCLSHSVFLGGRGGSCVSWPRATRMCVVL